MLRESITPLPTVFPGGLAGVNNTVADSFSRWPCDGLDGILHACRPDVATYEWIGRRAAGAELRPEGMTARLFATQLRRRLEELSILLLTVLNRFSGKHEVWE